MAFPWMALALGVPALFQALSGGQGTQEQITETEVPPTGYQSPLLGFADPLAFEMLLRRLQSFGAPSQTLGGTAGASYSPWIEKILSMLGGQWPTLLSGGASSIGGLGATGSPRPQVGRGE